jgi:hypothetical protein
MRTLSTRVIAIKIVGYLDFSTAKIYKTKAALKAAITLRSSKVARQVVKAVSDTKDYIKGVISQLMQGQILKDKLLAAKKLLKSKWTFERQRVYLTLMKLYGLHIESYLKAC